MNRGFLFGVFVLLLMPSYMPVFALSLDYPSETVYRTLYRIASDEYCKSKIELAKKYNLSEVECESPDRICYLGEFNKLEGGRDFCVYVQIEDEIPCYNIFGRCGRLEYLELLVSEEGANIPLYITYANPGELTIKPKIKVEVQDKNNQTIVRTFEEELGELKAGETMNYHLLLNTSDITSGTYNVWIAFSAGRKELIEKFDYELFSLGTFEREGDFSLIYSEPDSFDELRLTGFFKNSGVAGYSVRMKADIYLEGEKIEEVYSNVAYAEPREISEMKIEYSNLTSGNYKIFVKLENSEINRTLEFSYSKKDHITDLKLLEILLFCAVLIFILILLDVATKSARRSANLKEELL